MMNDNRTNLSESVAQDKGVSKEQAYLQFQQLHVRPWIRLWAKTLDIGILMSLINFVLLIFFLPIPFLIHIIASFFVVLIWFLLIEPYCLMEWGTTLGRFLFGVTLSKKDGSKLSPQDASSRSFKLWCRGFACGVPFLSLLANYLSYRRLIKTGTTSWDKDKYVVTHRKLRFDRLALAIIILFGPGILMVIYQFKHMPPLTFAPVSTSSVIQSTNPTNQQVK